MLARLAATFVLALLVSPPALAQNDGVVRVKSAYSMEETLARIKADVTAKGIMHFAEIDQAKPPQAPASRCVPRRCSSSATRRSARSSSPPSPRPG